MKTVIVSQRIDEYPDRNEIRDALDQKLIAFLLYAGFTAIPIPNAICKPSANKEEFIDIVDRWIQAVHPHAIVLSGGNNIGDFSSRDILETYLLDHASIYYKPVLGICRGMQMMAHWSGITLREVSGHIKTRHDLSGIITGEANSYHRLSIEKCPANFEILAQSQDGEIEAIRHISLPWEGWMWHPERESVFMNRDIERITKLFS